MGYLLLSTSILNESKFFQPDDEQEEFDHFTDEEEFEVSMLSFLFTPRHRN